MMNRPTPRRLEPETARKKIAAAKSNKPFMAALLDRDHRGHQDAVDQWSRLHQAAFPAVERQTTAPVSMPTARPARQGSAPIKIDEAGPAVSDRTGALTAKYRGSSAQQRRHTVRTAADQLGSVRERQIEESSPQAEEDDERAAIRDGVLPDPARPLDIQPSVLQSLRRRDRESHEDWLGRLQAELPNAAGDVDRLLVIREAILREIGFYDLGTGEVPEGWAMSRSEWAALAALQNVPEDGWRGAQQYSRAERETFEQIGELPLFGVVGPDGNIYHRLTIDGFHPIGDRLRVVNAFIRTARPHPPNIEAALATMAMMGAVGSPGKGVAPRLPMSAFAVPAAARYIRANRIAIGAGLAAGGVAGTALRHDASSEMNAAPDLPAVPGFEPSEPPDDDESFDEASIEVETVPGFEVQETGGPKVLIFPDVSEEIEQTLIIERRERQETRDQIDAVRDFYLRLHPGWTHHAGGRIAGTPTDMKEFRVDGPGVAFLHPVTGRRGDSRPGSIYADLTFITPSGKLVHIQTVDVDRNGLPTERELRAARRLADATGDPVYVVPKIWQLR